MLSKGGEIEGHVTSARGGATRRYRSLRLGCAHQATACATTNSGGTYLITGLPTGSFKVGFRPEPGSGLNYITQFYDDETSYKSADPIGVKAEEKKEGINAAMAVGAEIEGTVTSGETGAPSSDTPVCVSANATTKKCSSCADHRFVGRLHDRWASHRLLHGQLLLETDLSSTTTRSSPNPKRYRSK